MKDRFDYGKNPDKTEGGELISAYACDHMTADAEFLLSKAKYKATTGREQRRDADVLCYENGWLLEIQEPTVIRDAAVLMALNSALEPDGSINLPTRIIHRHPDFIAVITTNRGYNGCRPLNEALRDRVQHAEKMDLPSLKVMVERTACKTGCSDTELLQTFARIIIHRHGFLCRRWHHGNDHEASRSSENADRNRGRVYLGGVRQRPVQAGAQLY